MYKLPRINTVGSILARQKAVSLKTFGHRLQTINTSTNEIKPKSRFLFYVMGTVLTGVIGTAGIVVYSKNDPKFRELLTNNIPGADKFIKVCLFEDTEFVDQSKRLGGRIVCKVAQQVKSIKESIGVDEKHSFVEKSVDQIKSITKTFPPSVSLASNNEQSMPNKKQESQQSKSQPQDETIKTNFVLTKPDEKQELPPAPFNLPSHKYTLEELETEILKKSSLCVSALKTATAAIKEYSENVYKLIDNTTENIDPNLGVKLQILEDKKNIVYNNAYEDIKKYRKEISENQKLLSNSTFEVTPDKLAKTMHITNEALEELNNARIIMENEEHKLGYINKYKSNINEAQASLKDEFESLFPGSDITQHKINVNNNDFDIFLLYALKKLNYYKDNLSKQEATLDRKINNAMNADFLNVETINEMNSRLNSELHKLDEQFKHQLNQFNIKVDEDLREQLKAHKKAHADLITRAVDFTKEEFENRVRQELSAIEKLERQKYQSQLDSLKSDLQNVINNLKREVEKEKKLFANKSIWEASKVLKTSLSSSNNEQPINVKDQINAIKKLGASDSIVEEVISALPTKALENGVFSKGQLKEDFNQVEKRVYETALIPDDSFSLPLMAFSYLASLFVVHHSHISPNEVNNEEFDPLELNTYEIVERARYCIDRDNILQALRYLNLLTGCSRVVAKEWIKEATVFLETKQAVDLLLSYTTSISYSSVHAN
ncbi:MICOS complex subunit Mic60 [Acyrthosiphon pisum]|uniref:MICOS complex subunit MIC60 n=1 Tax=Acyrthosiphon pisum TaxID=7029 RepID=A0A8R2F746_ACYPI|nr:MICOS complex subunit Mic60 [Acyrthosiphon pisum]|eukprot:XP_008181676.1 PREDICTED: MICOS complex subunit Mic60 isoform X1 [Acyrthosiphon pisum]